MEVKTEEPIEKNTEVPIVQYADKDGNRAYALTHWDAIEDKPENPNLFQKVILESPTGTQYALSIDNSGKLLINDKIYQLENKSYQDQINALKKEIVKLTDLINKK